MQRLYMRDDSVPSALTAPGEIMVNKETVPHTRGQSEGKVPIVPARSKKNQASTVNHCFINTLQVYGRKCADSA